MEWLCWETPEGSSYIRMMEYLGRVINTGFEELLITELLMALSHKSRP